MAGCFAIDESESQWMGGVLREGECTAINNPTRRETAWNSQDIGFDINSSIHTSNPSSCQSTKRYTGDEWMSDKRSVPRHTK